MFWFHSFTCGCPVFAVPLIEETVFFSIVCSCLLCHRFIDSLRPHVLYNPWNSPGKNTGVGSVAFSRESSQPRDWTLVSRIAGRFFTSWATREAFVIDWLYVCEFISGLSILFDWSATWVDWKLILVTGFCVGTIFLKNLLLLKYSWFTVFC